MIKGRMVDLSYTLRPGSESRLCEVERLNANQVANVPLLPGQHYIMHNLRMVTHVGTHVEVPFHILKEGADTSTVPLNRWYGEAVVLDLRGLGPRQGATLEQVKAAVEKAGGIKEGDFVLLHTGWDRYYDTPQYKQSPYIEPDGIKWLVEKGVKMIGIDTGGAEVPNSEQHVNHHMMLDNLVPHIENVCNMAALKKSRVTLIAAPLAVEGLESMPLRVIAIEDED